VQDVFFPATFFIEQHQTRTFGRSICPFIVAQKTYADLHVFLGKVS